MAKPVVAPKNILFIGAGGAMLAPMVAAMDRAHKKYPSIRYVLPREGGNSTRALIENGITVQYDATATDMLEMDGDKPKLDASGKKIKLFRKETIHVAPNRYEVITPGEKPIEMDYIIVGVMSNDLDIESIRRFVGEKTRIIPIQNGIPASLVGMKEAPEAKNIHGEPAPVTYIENADPGRKFYDTFAPNLMGGLTAAAAVPIEDPVTKQSLPCSSYLFGDFRYGIGDIVPYNPANPEETSPEANWIVNALKAGGLNIHKPIPSTKMLKEIWLKLMGNGILNPLCTMYHVTLDFVSTDPDFGAVAIQGMDEMKAVAGCFGVEGLDSATRLKNTRGMNHVTSTAPVVWKGRPNEGKVLMGAPIELADHFNVLAPTLKVVYAAFNRFAQQCIDAKANFEAGPNAAGRSATRRSRSCSRRHSHRAGLARHRMKWLRKWLRFRDTFRTFCIAPPREIRLMFEHLRADAALPFGNLPGLKRNVRTAKRLTDSK
jgi:ketopantoate reductase